MKSIIVILTFLSLLVVGCSNNPVEVADNSQNTGTQAEKSVSKDNTLSLTKVKPVLLTTEEFKNSYSDANQFYQFTYTFIGQAMDGPTTWSFNVKFVSNGKKYEACGIYGSEYTGIAGLPFPASISDLAVNELLTIDKITPVLQKMSEFTTKYKKPKFQSIDSHYLTYGVNNNSLSFVLYFKNNGKNYKATGTFYDERYGYVGVVIPACISDLVVVRR